MTREIKASKEYLYLPIQTLREEKLVEFFYLDEYNQQIKFMEFMIPIGETTDDSYRYDYQACLPIKSYLDKTIMIKGDVPQAFLEGICVDSNRFYEPIERPLIHFTAQRGWINDPNGLVYQEGYYHLYFQYNPCNTKWTNMSWGHAVSKDLLHWEEKDMVLTPDEHGMMFSGSGIVNQRGLLQLPKDALLFFYTTAGSSTYWSTGKLCTQKIAYSLDHGDTLIKTEIGTLDTICEENRDPKVFWHEESQAYIMCLWLEKNDFAILRSVDLILWEQSDRFTLKDAWECPDLVKIPTQDGNDQWMFWSADGFYYWGEFDGYKFTTDEKKHHAYINKQPYAAQTYSGITDRVVSLSWVRSKKEGRLYTGAMAIPRELSVVTYQGDQYLSLQPIRELNEYSKLIYDKSEQNSTSNRFMMQQEKAMAVSMDMVIKPNEQPLTVWNICDITVSYHRETGILSVGVEEYQIGKDIRDFFFLVDDVIFEVTANYGIILGVFELPRTKFEIDVDVEQFEEFQAYQIN